MRKELIRTRGTKKAAKSRFLQTKQNDNITIKKSPQKQMANSVSELYRICLYFSAPE